MIFYKSFIKYFFIVSFFIILPFCALINYIIDPYGSNKQYKLNYNQVKIGSIKRPLHYKLPIVKEGNIDNILIGTSRIGILKPEIVSGYLGGRTFNLSSPSSLTDEQYYLLRYAIKYNSVKNVIYSIDFLSLNGKKEKSSSEFDELKDDIINYSSIYENPNIYFNIDSLIYSVKMIFGVKSTTYLENGSWRSYPRVEELIKNNQNEFDYNENMIETSQYTPYKYSSDKMNYVKKIIKLCKDNNIKLYIYTPPVYAEHFKNIFNNRNKDYVEFKKELSQTTSYIDFSGINEISIKKENYYDASHLREGLSEEIFKRVFKDNDVSFSNVIGVKVDKHNNDTHINNLFNQVKGYNIKKN